MRRKRFSEGQIAFAKSLALRAHFQSPGNARGFRSGAGRSQKWEMLGWGGRIRTSEWRNQNPLPYHLATPQQAASRPKSTSMIPKNAARRFGSDHASTLRLRARHQFDLMHSRSRPLHERMRTGCRPRRRDHNAPQNLPQPFRYQERQAPQLEHVPAGWQACHCVFARKPFYRRHSAIRRDGTWRRSTGFSRRLWRCVAMPMRPIPALPSGPRS